MLKTAEQVSLISSEEQHLSEIEIFCNIIHFFITFDQLHASLLNKSTKFYNFLKKYIILTLSCWMHTVYNDTKAFYLR